jgi:excisionase family DNA binding protein
MTTRRYLTVEQIVARLQVDKETVRRWLRTGRLNGIRPGGSKAGYRVTEEDLQKFLAVQNPQAREEFENRSTMSIDQYEAETLNWYIENIPSSVSVVEDGINALKLGLEACAGLRDVSDERVVQMAMFSKSVNDHWSSFRLALRGYPLQARNLLRFSEEAYLAYFYLQDWPDTHLWFLTAGETPDAAEMRDALERKHPKLKPHFDAWQDALSRQHPFSHIDAQNIRRMLSHSGEQITFNLGPNRDVVEFDEYAGEACRIIANTALQLDAFCRNVGVPSPKELSEFNGKVNAMAPRPSNHVKRKKFNERTILDNMPPSPTKKPKMASPSQSISNNQNDPGTPAGTLTH